MEKPFKRKRDEGKRRVSYWFRYVDETGKRRQKKGFTDKGETERLQAKLQHEADLRRRGLIDAEQEALIKRKNSAIADTIDAFATHIKGDNTPKYVKQLINRLKRIIKECGFTRPADINSNEVELFLNKLVAEENCAPRTRNHYLQAFQEYCNWLIAVGYLTSNPIVGIKALNAEIAVRHKRRALTPEETSKLVAAAKKSRKLIQCFNGETRAILYKTAYGTGLRRNELASLTPESFDLNDRLPTVTVQAAFSKHRKKDVLPLHKELVAELRKWLVGKPARQPIFPKLGERRTWLMVKKDLQAAGIPYETPEGIADFHAAGRHTHVTELLRNGASLPEVKELARHSDIRTTMRYTHIGMDDQAKAVQRLPWHHSGTNPGVSRRQRVSSCDTSSARTNGSREDVSPGSEGTSVTSRPLMSLADTSEDETTERVRFPPPPIT